MTADASDVLVVDRVESAAETVSGLQDRLESLSFALATDVPEAARVVADGRVDCVVSNFEIPRADGVEFVGAFALLDAVRDVDADVPFVLYTDVGNEAIAETAFERGVTEYVPKTVGDGSVRRLADRVERVVEHRRDQRRFERQARIDELLRDVNQSLVRADDRDTIESTVVDRLAADGGYAFATWVRSDDPDAATAPVADALETGDLETGDCTIDDFASATNADGAWADDVDDLPGPVAAVPVAYDDETYGTIVVGTHEAAFDDTERAVLAELGDTVGDAIDAADTRQALRDQNERLEAFASVVSHDLRNPLAVARAYASELDDSDAITESDADAVDAIEESLERMDVLVDDMLELARNGADDRDRRYSDLADLAHQAWSTVDTGDATLGVDSDVGHATVDRSRVAQLFENAYRNSVEHSDDAVAVTVVGVDDGFAIADDGPGIPPGERERVRDLGYSGDDGTGLGLAIVQDVVDAHDWTLELTASDSGGARLEIRDVDVER
jgi:signal transduction histidine kinase